MATAEQIKIANSTSRNGRGAVGKDPLCYRAFRQIFGINQCKFPDMKVLDFGAGKHMVHTKALRERGYDIDAYEFGDNVTDEHVSDITLNYDVVIASNVLNVQSDIGMFIETLDLISGALRFKGGKAIVNYPTAPRKSDLTTMEVKNLLFRWFEQVDSLGNNVYFCKYPKVQI